MIVSYKVERTSIIETEIAIKFVESIIMGPNKSNFSEVLRVGARIQQVKMANTWHSSPSTQCVWIVNS